MIQVSEKQKVTWVGRSVPSEDLLRLAQGQGKYTADVDLPGTLQMAVVRSQHAHARIGKIDLSEALSMPGVVAAFGPEDGRHLPELPVLVHAGDQKIPGYRVFFARALYVGQPLVFIAAESRYLAEDAAEAVVV